jgi:hypothetical protein
MEEALSVGDKEFEGSENFLCSKSSFNIEPQQPHIKQGEYPILIFFP